MNRKLGLAGVILGWGLVVFSGMLLIWDTVMLILLLIGRIEPGGPVGFDSLAPSMAGAVVIVIVEAAVVAAGFALKQFAGRHAAGKPA